MGAPNIQHAFQQRHLSSPAADWRNNVVWPHKAKALEEAPEEAVEALVEPEVDATPEPEQEPGASAETAMTWLKSDLTFYAEGVGVDSSGTKADIVSRLVAAGYLTR